MQTHPFQFRTLPVFNRCSHSTETIPEAPLTAVSGIHDMAFVDLYLKISGVNQAGSYKSKDCIDLI